MTNRLELLQTARAKLDNLQDLSNQYRTDGSDKLALKTAVAKATDELIVFVRTNFPADEELAASVSRKPQPGTAMIPSSKAFSEQKPLPVPRPLTEDEQALKDAVRSLYSGGTGEPPKFEPETLVDARDGVIVVVTMKHLLSTIRAPVDTQQTEHFEDFSQTYKGVILA